MSEYFYMQLDVLGKLMLTMPLRKMKPIGSIRRAPFPDFRVRFHSSIPLPQTPPFPFHHVSQGWRAR